MTYDLSELEQLGDEYEQLTERLKQVRAGLRAGVAAAHDAGVQQVAIIKASHYTREAVRTIIREHQAEQER